MSRHSRRTTPRRRPRHPGPAAGEVLAALRDDLQRSDPDLAASLSRLGAPSSRRWWIGVPAALAVLGGTVWLAGLPGLAVLWLAAVLSSPLVIGLALPPAHGPKED